MVTQMAQFIDHDITFTPEDEVTHNCCAEKNKDNKDCFPIVIPSDDDFYAKENVKCLSFHVSTKFCDGEKITGKLLSLKVLRTLVSTGSNSF